MIIYVLPDGAEGTVSGGTRKLYDHVEILRAHGFDVTAMHYRDAARRDAQPGDLLVIPEIFGDGIRDLFPRGVRRMVFVQNGYLIDEVDGLTIVKAPRGRHPYMTTPDLVAVLTESDLSTRIVRERFRRLRCPVIRTHSSGNGRRGESAGFSFGAWPRKQRVVYFGYKHEADNAALFDGLDLPAGWEACSMTGQTDAEIAESLRTAAIFVATNRDEGMCAPTSEAMISGTLIVCWTGGGPDEYLTGRAVIAEQGNVAALRAALADACAFVDLAPDRVGEMMRQHSDWFQETYSRQREIDEIVEIMDEYHGRN